MSQSNDSANQNRQGKKRELPLGAVLLLAGVAVAAVLYWPASKPPSDTSSAPTPAPATAAVSSNASNTGATGSASKSYLHKLSGKWLRLDDRYVIDIRKVSTDGKVEAGYYNPQPIHVAKAEAKLEGPATKLFVELRDTGYPGCTYTLTYDPDKDTLEGIYYQASMQEEFQVVFVRMEQ